jgi:predicted component of type VI protein secretion system
MIAFDLEATIKEFEPRVELVSVSAFPNYDENNLNVVIDYRIIGLGAGTNQLSFALTPTRR